MLRMFVRFFFFLQDMLIARHSPLHPKNKHTDGVYPSADAVCINRMNTMAIKLEFLFGLHSGLRYTLLKEINATCRVNQFGFVAYSGEQLFQQSQPVQEDMVRTGNDGLPCTMMQI